jgi:hypothetical protein
MLKRTEPHSGSANIDVGSGDSCRARRWPAAVENWAAQSGGRRAIKVGEAETENTEQCAHGDDATMA